MFRDLAPNVGDARDLFRMHPVQIYGLMEGQWLRRANPAARPARALPTATLLGLSVPAPPPGATAWDHLIYAFLIENTGIDKICRRVVSESVHDERLEIASPDSLNWLRNSEELFCRSNPAFLGFGLTSDVRPNVRASRRNVYYRMFGMELAHEPETEEHTPYPNKRVTAANVEFVPTLEAFLREVGRGITDAANARALNRADLEEIVTMAGRLQDMLSARRRAGSLSREEFLYVATMSWWDLTVQFNTPIVGDLKATATTPAERLQKMGEQVDVPADPRSWLFFALARPLSRLLREIEEGDYNTMNKARRLYDDDTERNRLTPIITHWSKAMGRDLWAGAGIQR